MPAVPGRGGCVQSWASGQGVRSSTQHVGVAADDGGAQAAHVMEEGAGGFMRWLSKHAHEMARDIGLVLRIPTFNIVVLQARPLPSVRAGA